MTEVFEGGSGLQPARLRQTPSWLLTQTATLTKRLVGAALADVGATRYQYAVLAAVEEFGPISQAELGRRCHIDRSDIVATLNELASGGHIDRNQDPDDRRQNLVTLTGTGRGRLERIAHAVHAAQSTLFGDLSQARRADLVAALQRILDSHAESADQQT